MKTINFFFWVEGGEEGGWICFDVLIFEFFKEKEKKGKGNLLRPKEKDEERQIRNLRAANGRSCG